MSEHVAKFKINPSEPQSAHLERLAAFYVHNGYVEEERPESAEPSLRLTRGKPGAGWWSSEMTKLHTVLLIEEKQNILTLTYTVDVKGQRLSEEDKAFWEREVASAERYMLGTTEELRDLRHQEARRAAAVQEELRTKGVRGAFLVFAAIVVVAIFLERTGFLWF